MKIQLSIGECNIGAFHKSDFSVPDHLREQFPDGRRGTKVFVVLPNGKELRAESVCHTNQPFVKKTGKKLAVVNLFAQDREQAEDMLSEIYGSEAYSGTNLPEWEDYKRQHVQAHYKLCRADRRLIFQKLCPEFFTKTPEQKQMRERLLLERLKAKYEPEENLKMAAK